MVDIPSVYTDLDLVFTPWSLVEIEFVKIALICDRLFPIDIYDTHMLISLCCKLTPGSENMWITICLGRDQKTCESLYHQCECYNKEA